MRYVMPATVNEATSTATQKQYHHHAGVLPSIIPQILSVIHEKLRLFSTSTARGKTAGFTSVRIAARGAVCSAWLIRGPPLSSHPNAPLPRYARCGRGDDFSCCTPRG